MWVCLVQMRAQPGKEAELLSMCEQWLEGAGDKGCLRAEVLFDPRDPSLISLLEHWESQERFETNAAQEMADADFVENRRFGDDDCAVYRLDRAAWSP